MVFLMLYSMMIGKFKVDLKRLFPKFSVNGDPYSGSMF